MRIALASFLAATASLVGGTVVTQLYPTIDPAVGYALLVLCAILYLIAGYLWWTARKVGEGRIMAGDSINQSHSGSGHNIGKIENLHLGSQRFEMTEAVMSEIASHLDAARPVSLVWRDTGRTPKMVETLEAYLKKRGFTIGQKLGFGFITGVDFEHPLVLAPNGFNFNGLILAGGDQAIGIDASVPK